jgi:integrase
MSLSLFFPAQTSDPLAELRRMLWNSLVSAHTRRAYIAAFNQFFSLVTETGRPVCRALLMEYRAQMIDQGLSASTINVRLSAIRKLVSEARDNNLLDPVEAARILTVPGVPMRGVRLGNWLTPEEAKNLLAVPDRGTLIGKRAFAILSVLVYCALRREELSRLEARHIQKREGRWVVADLVGKRGRVRTVPIPDAAKAALDEWLATAGIESGFLFRQLLRSGLVRPAAISSWTVWNTVVTAAKSAGIEHLGPHDLRRTCAKFCRKAGGDIEQVQELLGHAVSRRAHDCRWQRRASSQRRPPELRRPIRPGRGGCGFVAGSVHDVRRQPGTVLGARGSLAL